MLTRHATRFAPLAAVLLAAAILGPVVPAHATAGRSSADPAWAPCTDAAPAAYHLDCATIKVPLDHARPNGPTITIAVSRRRATAPKSQRLGALFTHAGAPGAAGRVLPGALGSLLPAEVAARYDIIGIDPRGVGASKPAMRCDPDQFKPVWPEPVPASRAAERALRNRTTSYVRACARHHRALLGHMSTVDHAEDLNAVRRALGLRRISYLGVAYGTYLGAVYATRHPHNLTRLVLDSAIAPSRIWYQQGLDHADGLDDRAADFFAWIARHDDVYGLGSTARAVRTTYYRTRSAVHTTPAGGLVGPHEMDFTFFNAGFDNSFWPLLARALAAYAGHADTGPLLNAYRLIGARPDDNAYAVNSATECTDTRWPRGWARWHADATRHYRRHPFAIWTHTWYNSPCAVWPVRGRRPARISGRQVPGALILHGTRDGAESYRGALEMRRLFGSARLVSVVGGMNQAVSLQGNACVDTRLSAYLLHGRLPRTNVTCAPIPQPRPTDQPASASPGLTTLARSTH